MSDSTAPAASGRAVSLAGYRRNQALLSGAQLLSGVGISSGISVGGVLAGRITHNVGLAGMAQTSTVLGAAVFANPLARIALERGRHRALPLGFAVGAVGAALIILATKAQIAPLLFVGLFLFGSSTASGLQTRYAATDLAPEGHHARALSIVMWAATIGSVLGPNLSDRGAQLGDHLRLAALSGPYLFSFTAFAAAALLCMPLFRPTPTHQDHTDAEKVGLGHRLHLIAANPRARLGMTAVVTGQTMMTTVMVMTPIHMNLEGMGLARVGIVISGHILGMYAFSPLVGALADRLGARTVIITGWIIFATAFTLGIVDARTGSPQALLTFALFLLGLAWSCTMIGGSSLLTHTFDPSTRVSIQGLTDSLMNFGSAIAAAVAGPILSWGGFTYINAWAALFLIPMALLLVQRGGSTASA